MQIAAEQKVSITVARRGDPNDSAVMLRALAYGFCAAFWIYIVSLLL